MCETSRRNLTAPGAVCSQTNIGIAVIVVWLDQVFARCVIHMAHNITLWLMLFFVLFCLLLRLIHSIPLGSQSCIFYSIPWYRVRNLSYFPLYTSIYSVACCPDAFLPRSAFGSNAERRFRRAPFGIQSVDTSTITTLVRR